MWPSKSRGEPQASVRPPGPKHEGVASPRSQILFGNQKRQVGVREAQNAVSKETVMRCFKCGKHLSFFAGTVCPSCYSKEQDRTILMMAFLCAVGGFCLGLLFDGIGAAIVCTFCGMLIGTGWGASVHATLPPQQINTAARYPHDYGDKLPSQHRSSSRRVKSAGRSK
jgi:hypothetical protein